jgi:uncharacterized protein (TIGR02246 family)
MKSRWLCMAAMPVLLLDTAPARSQKDNAEAEAALLKKAESFVACFHKADAKGLAAHWTSDGDYTLQTGKTLKGRTAIEKAFQEFFAEHTDYKLRIDISSMRFVTPDVCIEDRTASVLPPDGAPPSRARYTNVHVKRNGGWYLSSVRDAVYAPPTNRHHLSELEWLIGSWADTNDKGEVARATYTWGENENFILSEFTTTFKQFAIGGGTQRIGYDPSARQLRSWVFERDGGFGEGRWTRDGNRWTIKAAATHPDGKKLAAINTIVRVGPDTLTWESRQRTADGQAIPDVKPITMKRVK